MCKGPCEELMGMTTEGLTTVQMVDTFIIKYKMP